jgi:hypothetical protein
MSATEAGMFRKIGFNLLGAATALAGLTLVLSGALSASVNEAHPNGLGKLAKGRMAAMRQRLASDLAPEKGASISLADAAMATQLFSRMPLDPDAQTYLALVAAAKGDAPRARALMELALRSDGRSVRPRLWLIDRALRHRDYPTAVALLDRLITVIPLRRAQTVAAMAAIVRDPASHPAITKMLATNPGWREDFLYAVNQQGMPADAIFRLTAQNSAKASALFEQSALLQTLLKNHEYERAYLAWVNFLPEASLKQVGAIYDTEFANLAGPAPFNWQLLNSADGSAEFRLPKGLTASYLGAAPATLAQQTILLSPGRYRLSTIASAGDEYNQLAWVITCARGGDPVVTTRLLKLSDARQKYSSIFQIPASGCEAQQLALIGTPGEFPRTADAQIDAIHIEPVTS